MTGTPWFAEDVQERAAEAAEARRTSLVVDLDVLADASLPGLPAGDLRTRLLTSIVDLFIGALRGASLADSPALRDLGRPGTTTVNLRDLFTVVRLAERSVESELAIESEIGATSEHWPAVVDGLRKASFDLLASYCEMSTGGRPGCDATDSQELVSQATFDIALDKELARAVRHHHPMALILFDVDGLSAINEIHGCGVGDQVLERVGVFLRQYFRQLDWVARHGTDAIAVLLPETSGRDAERLAEGARRAVEERLVFPDRDDRPVSVTVSGCVVTVTVGRAATDAPTALDSSKVMEEAEAAVRRAKACGGNSIERVEVARASLSVTEAASYLHCAPRSVRKLIENGTLPSIQADGHTRVDRLALEAYGKRTRNDRRS